MDGPPAGMRRGFAVARVAVLPLAGFLRPLPGAAPAAFGGPVRPAGPSRARPRPAMVPRPGSAALVPSAVRGPLPPPAAGGPLPPPSSLGGVAFFPVCSRAGAPTPFGCPPGAASSPAPRPAPAPGLGRRLRSLRAPSRGIGRPCSLRRRPAPVPLAGAPTPRRAGSLRSASPWPLCGAGSSAPGARGASWGPYPSPPFVAGGPPSLFLRGCAAAAALTVSRCLLLSAA